MNKLTNSSYFIKRLKDNGYVVLKLFDNYAITDNRTWTVVIDPGGASVFCTCYLNYSHEPENRSYYFELYDGGRYIPSSKLKISTESIEILIEYLKKFKIVSKTK